MLRRLGRAIVLPVVEGKLGFVAALLVRRLRQRCLRHPAESFAKRKPTNVATDDELDLDFEIN